MKGHKSKLIVYVSAPNKNSLFKYTYDQKKEEQLAEGQAPFKQVN